MTKTVASETLESIRQCHLEPKKGVMSSEQSLGSDYKPGGGAGFSNGLGPVAHMGGESSSPDTTSLRAWPRPARLASRAPLFRLMRASHF